MLKQVIFVKENVCLQKRHQFNPPHLSHPQKFSCMDYTLTKQIFLLTNHQSQYWLLQEDFNLTLPDWTNGIYPNRLVPLTVFSFVLNAYNTELQKLKGGKLPSYKYLVIMNKLKGKTVPEILFGVWWLWTNWIQDTRNPFWQWQ